MAEHHPKIPSEDELKKLPSDGGGYWNRLVFEQSPYLLQHAANPVDWYPWSDEAFEKAKTEDKPIFLSIGYATCHWCHVMERESFEDAEVAALLNRDFVAIKVDREERPDIDQLHMAACQSMTGGGGWPLNCVLTPQGQVFYATTYLPKRGQYGRPGMMELVPSVARAWQQQREVLLNGADQLNNQLQALSGLPAAGVLDENIEHQAYRWFEQTFDAEHGGFGDAPKFPLPHQYLFLLRYWYRTGNDHALMMVKKSLLAMRLGGLFDHIGYGFHRYSTDNRWLVPHFEKMLYDQALMLMAYSEAYAATGDDFYKQTAEEVVEYLKLRMLHPDGGFYSAEDADSEGEEGKFYIWRYEELKEVLTQDELTWLERDFCVFPKGNYIDEASGRMTGANILHLSEYFVATTDNDDREKVISKTWRTEWQVIRNKLYQHREKREHPMLDDKLLSAWNGLAIAALARCSLLLDCRDGLEMAQNAFYFIRQNLVDENAFLIKRYRNGRAGLPAHLDDYASLIWAVLELHQTTLNNDYLKQALDWTEIAIDKFWDDESHGFYFTEANTELAVRAKEIYDGAEPSGNAMMARNLAFLYRLTGETCWQTRFNQLIAAFAPQINRYPAGYTLLLTAVELMKSPGQHLLLSGRGITADILNPLKGQYLPDTVWLTAAGRDGDKDRAQEGKGSAESELFSTKFPANKQVMCLCLGTACELPIIGRANILARLIRLVAEDRS